MYLEKSEERALKGECGWAKQVAMGILVKLGDLYGADRLIPIRSAHVSGVSYKTLGEAASGFIKELADSGSVVSAPTTLNPAAFDPERPEITGANPQRILAQKRILGFYRKLGVNLTLTCTPYYIDRPQENTHLSWAESSAVVYTNSVLGAWTNREGGPSALAAAIVGKTPNYGIHKPENRRGEIDVKVEADAMDMHEFGALGIHLGGLIGEKVPAIRGLRKPSEMKLKQLAAALGSSGMASIFKLSRSSDPQIREKIVVDREALEETLQSLSGGFRSPDLVFIGCPHCSYPEIATAARLMKGRRVKDNITFLVCTSRHVKRSAEDRVKVIERAGGKVLSDACVVVSWIEDTGVDRVMTNSAKTAYYAPTFNKVEATLASLKDCIDAACYG